MPAICAAIRQTREEDPDITQEVLARRLGLKRNTNVSRWETTRVPSLDQLTKIEAALGRPRGFLLRRAGYVDDPKTTADAIDADPALDARARSMVLNAYRLAADDSARESSSSARTKPADKARTRRK